MRIYALARTGAMLGAMLGALLVLPRGEAPSARGANKQNKPEIQIPQLITCIRTPLNVSHFLLDEVATGVHNQTNCLC